MNDLSKQVKQVKVKTGKKLVSNSIVPDQQCNTCLYCRDSLIRKDMFCCHYMIDTGRQRKGALGKCRSYKSVESVRVC